MGCCRSKRRNQGKKLLSVKASTNDYYEKENQQKQLDEIYETVESHINQIRSGV